MKKDNKGFSLVELIVVIAIMSIVIVGAIIGVGAITGKPAEKCANQISAVLNSCRNASMGKLGSKVSFYYDAAAGKVIATEQFGTSSKQYPISDAGVKFEFLIEGESTNRELDSTPLVITFDRSSGGIAPLNDDNATALRGKVLKKIILSKADKCFELKISSLTGRVEITQIP